MNEGAESETEYLRRELREFVDLASKAVRHFQKNPGIITGNVHVIVIAGHDPEYTLANFWERSEQLEKVARGSYRRGERCEIEVGDRRPCPNFEFNDGDETYSFNCSVCGIKGGGEHPQ